MFEESDPLKEGSNAVDQFGKRVDDVLTKLGNAFASNFSPKQIIIELYKVDEAASKIVKQFGQGRENIVALKGALVDSSVEVAKLGGGFEDIVKMQSDISADLGRNVILSSDIYEKLFASEKVTGVATKEMTTAFKDIGISSFQAAENMEKIVHVAQAIGVNAQAVSQLVVSNLDKLNKYNFQGGVEGLAKMAAQATSMRFSMDQTFQFAEKIYNPEDAIEMAAALQRLGVTQSQLLDPLRLMDLSRNDPAELQNQLVQMTQKFVKLNEAGQFEILPGAKSELRELEKSMGLSYGQLTKMAIGAAELEEKMSRITFPELEIPISKEEEQLIANMAEMGTENKFQITFKDEKGEKVTKAIEDLVDTDIKNILESQRQAPKTLEEIQKSQLSVLEDIEANIKSIAGRTGKAISGSRGGEQILGFQKELYQNLGNIFSDKGVFNIKDLREKIGGGIDEVLKQVAEMVKTGEVDPSEALSKVTEGLVGGVDYMIEQLDLVGENFGVTVDTLSKSNNALSNITGDFLEMISKIVGIEIPDRSKEMNNVNKVEDKKEENQSTSENATSQQNINLNVTVTSNSPNVTAEEIGRAMTDQGVLETLTQSMASKSINNGLTNPNGKQITVTTNYGYSIG